MKITSFQLEQQLKQGPLAKLYLVCGEEPFLIQETLALLRQKAEQAGFSDRLRLDLETEADLESCYGPAYSPPLLGQKRLLELHWKGKLGKAGQNFLVSYAKQPSPYAIVFAKLGKLDSKTEQTQWFKALEKNACIIPLWPLPTKQLPGWLVARAKARNFDLSPEAAQQLALRVEGNLAAAAQEIEKLSLLGLPRIEAQLIEEMVVDQGSFNAFDLVEQTLAGKTAAALRALRYLRQEGSEAPMILGAFTHELRLLCKLAQGLHKGNPLATLFNQYRVRLSRQNAVAAFLKRHSERDCLNFILMAGELDRLIKGALPGSIWENLEDFCLALAGPKRPRTME